MLGDSSFVPFVEKYYLVQFESEHSVAICDEKMIVKSGEAVEVIVGDKKYPATIEAEGKYMASNHPYWVVVWKTVVQF